jgi:hypothetical protein
LELGIPLVWGGDRLNPSGKRSQVSSIRSHLRFAVQAAQFVKVTVSSLAVARFLAFLA